MRHATCTHELLAPTFPHTPQAVCVLSGMFPNGPSDHVGDIVDAEPSAAEAYLAAYKRRPYRTPAVPKVDRSLYRIEYHHGEASGCTRHPVTHDTDRSFVLSYADIPIGLAGFDLDASQDAGGCTLVVSQIQGTRYTTRHSGRHTGAEAPARSVTWQPALLNLIIAFASLVDAADVHVVPHHKRRYAFGRHNVEMLYDGTAQQCGFEYDADHEVWTKTIVMPSLSAREAE